MAETRVFAAFASAETGRFVPAERLIDRDDLALLVDRLVSVDQGYVEVRRVVADFPALLVGFRKGFAVVHCMQNPESMTLLGGDDSVAASESVDVLIMDDLVPFTGAYVMESARARDVLLQFVDGADVHRLGDWHDHY